MKPRLTKYIPITPHPKQTAFLLLNQREVLYGGAAGGGKSAALLAAALQYADMPGYNALILRRTFAQLSKPGALIDLAREWLSGTDARWNQQDHKWTFPSGATLTFGHMENEASRFDYLGGAYHFVGFDELTQFLEVMYRYLFSRLRRGSDSAIPSRMRATSNPGGVGHDWVKKWFISPEARAAGRIFMPAKLADNPSLDYADYVESLSQLDPVTKAQLLAGDWDAFEGGRFRRAWFRRYEERDGPDGRPHYFLQGKADPVRVSDCWRFSTLDPAATEKETSDYTVIATFGVTPRRDLLILDVVRRRMPIDEIVPACLTVAAKWRPHFIGIEDSGFQAGILLEAKRTRGMPAVVGMSPAGKGKLVRATPAIVRCEAGQIFFPGWAPWLEELEGELLMFTGDEKMDAHDDQVDALAYAVQQLDRAGPFKVTDVSGGKRAPRREQQQTAAQRRGLFGTR